jgi:hypothetical protein
MKVFALGGYGKVGIPAIKLLAQSDLVTEIAIVGRNLERAEKAATEIGEKAVAVHADGTDEQKLTSLLAGYDIIMNAATNKAVLPAIRAAIHNGTHYCDVAHGDFIEQAMQLASEAEGAGITSVIANGISPGISNLMGVHVSRQLEEVEQLQLGRAEFIEYQSGQDLTPQQWLGEPQKSLAALHEFRAWIVGMLRIIQQKGTRTALDFQDRRWVEIDPIRSGLEVPIQKGATINSYPYVSCDSFWGAIPSDLCKVSPVELWFSPLPPQLQAVLREQALRVVEEDVDPEIATSSFYDIADSDPHRWLILPDDYTPAPKMWGRAVGRKGGRAARFSCWFTAPIWNVNGWFLTSVALAAAVRKILRGEIIERGVMTAEKAFDPLPFFDEVASLLPDSLPDGKLINESFEWLE